MGKIKQYKITVKCVVVLCCVEICLKVAEKLAIKLPVKLAIKVALRDDPNKGCDFHAGSPLPPIARPLWVTLAVVCPVIQLSSVRVLVGVHLTVFRGLPLLNARDESLLFPL